MPLDYGDPAAEYQAAHTTAFLRDTCHFGRLRISGADSLDFLHRIGLRDTTTCKQNGVFCIEKQLFCFFKVKVLSTKFEK